MSKTKRNALLLLSAAGIFTLLLAMSVPTLDLAPGQVFTLEKTHVTLPGEQDSSNNSGVPGRLFQGAIALAIVLFPVYIIYSLFSAKGRRRLVRHVIMFVCLFVIASYLDNHPLSMDDTQEDEASASGVGDVNAELPVAEFPDEGPPTWLAIGVILAASALGMGLLWAGIMVLRQRAAEADLALNPLAEAAQDTLDSLQAGGDFETAIIRCYHEMNLVVKQQRGLAREVTMTPHEFEEYLVGKGLPHGAVATLTRLFERARYGSVLPGAGDETQALACLTEIVRTCQPVGGGLHE